MTDGIVISSNLGKFSADLLNAPDILEKHVGRSIKRSLLTISRDARRDAAKAFTTLTSSIQVAMLNPLEGITGPTVNYGEHVERGTGPQGFPPLQAIIDWISVKKIQPADPSLDVRDLAFLIVRKISRKGTPKQPYLEPAARAHEADVVRDMDNAIQAALVEISKR